LARRFPLRALHEDRFLRELRHFLWVEPSVIGGAADAGWSCRDHAWVTALLSRSLGYQPALFHGEAFFAMGPSGRSAGVSVSQKPHSWVVVEGAGTIDLSIRADVRIDGGHFRLPVTCIFADAWLPHGRGNACFLADARAYAHAIEDLPQRRNTLSAMYLVNEAEQFHAGLITRAAGWIRSPLAHRLGSAYGNPSDLYAALALHLRAFLEDETQSLTGLPAMEAWNWLARAREGAIERACRCIEESSATGLPLSAQITGQGA
jgi:hypothetical protein